VANRTGAKMSAPPFDDTNRVAVFGSQLLGVLIVIATVFTQQGELHSWRPTGTKNQPAAKDDQNADKFARLWDDPLDDFRTFPVAVASLSPTPTPAEPAVQNQGMLQALPSVALAASPAAPAQAQSQTRRAAQNQGVPAPLPASGSAEYTFLWNIVDARPLPEITERRRRIRYALVSAILAEGYLPLRESVLSPLFEAGSESLPLKDGNLVGRFETFRKPESKDGQNWCYVSVIWTPKQSRKLKLPIDPNEIDRIEKAICEKDQESSEDKAVTINDKNTWFLHHGNSDDLVNLSAASESPPPNTSFLRATVRLDDLPSPPANWEDWASLQKITTDDALIKSLVAELSLRIPALNGPRKAPAPRVVVFTESDTTYSRAITNELAAQLKNVTLEIYSYLRALDGRPDEQRNPETGEDSKSQEAIASLLQRRAISETSFGTSQFDYLRRTALDLKAKRNQPGENVVAVGILGSDIYDKMLVLQAVRPALPSAVFFTTDLDALYLEREMQPFTRNLVVASADDLDVKERGNSGSDRWKLPPMRDSYQTVLVKEVQHILRQGHGKDKPTGRVRIFEIGAGKQVHLTDARGISWLLWWLAQPWFNALVFIPALLNAFLILWAVTTRDLANKPAGAMKKWAQWVVYGEASLAGLGLVLLLLKLTIAKSDLLFGEPLSLGISIWPTVMIRLLAFLVAIVLLSLASYSFVVYGSPPEDNLKNALPENVKFRCRKGMWGLWGPSDEVGRDEFFEKLFAANARKRRIVIVSLAYLAFSFVLFAVWPPSVPARGGLALLIEKIVLALGVALYIIHLIFCLELHVSALRLLRQLRLLYSSAADENHINATQTLAALSTLTTVIGKTLLYPLTVLILIILSRLTIFDNWVMTPSLMLTFMGGAIVLVGASLFLWLEGARLKKVVLGQDGLRRAEKKKLAAINDGVFAAWYSQPIFSAIFSVAAVFGSLSVARPLARLFFAS
jgi:hypothetical protein